VRDTPALPAADPLPAGVAPTLDALRERRAAIRPVAAAHGGRSVRVFGSVARGDAEADSDVDFLVEMEPGQTLLDRTGIRVGLGELLDRPVDVVTVGGLNARMRARVLAEAVLL
jgi:predicted nucleotidyltransferase